MPTRLHGLDDFLREHRLPAAYAATAQRWFLPLADTIAQRHAAAGRPLLIGINGAQGSGKSTLAALLRRLLEARGLRALDLSIDDFYLGREPRRRLAREVHPLFVTRGVPGTHDIPLMRTTLRGLLQGSGPLAIPRFDKAADERIPEDRWEQVDTPVDLVLLEGWCLGTPPQDEAALARPVNALEAQEDPDGRWRHHVNERLREDYQPLFAMVDHWVMLAAPSFECVYHWRLEAERKLAEDIADPEHANHLMDAPRLARFVQHYQRLTEHTLACLPKRVQTLFTLDEQRRITGCRQADAP